MRILQVLAGLHLGGAEQLVASLSGWLQRRGHTVLVANITDEAGLLYAFLREGVRVQQVSVRGALCRLYPVRLVRLIRGFRPDVVHCHETAWLKTAAACRWTRTPLLMTLHGHLSEWLQRHRSLLARAARFTRFCVGVTPDIQQLFVSVLRVPSEKAVYVRNGIPDIWAPECCAYPDWQAPIPPESMVVGMVARFDGKFKDQATLIRATALARQRIPTLHLVLIGNGPARQAAQGLVEEIGAHSYVHFLGHRQDVSNLLHHMHLFVLSSTSEGESIALLEAMSAQRPIIATAVGGTPALLAGGECGILTRPCDVQAMSEAIVGLLTHPDKAQALAQRARQRFLQEYTIDRMAERYLELYQQAIEGVGAG